MRPSDTVAMPQAEAYADAIAEIETGGIREDLRDTAVGDNGAALGRYQLHEIFVREANRILGCDYYRPEDRTDPVKARDMTLSYATWIWNGLDVDDRTHRNVARCHNGGPRGWTKTATLGYAEKFDAIWRRHA